VSELRFLRRDYCIGGVCEVRCVYRTDKGSELSFDIGYGYKSEDVGLGDWEYDDVLCRAEKPEQCNFYLTK
jgi:hypothetical protein